MVISLLLSFDFVNKRNRETVKCMIFQISWREKKIKIRKLLSSKVFQNFRLKSGILNWTFIHTFLKAEIIFDFEIVKSNYTSLIFPIANTINSEMGEEGINGIHLTPFPPFSFISLFFLWKSPREIETLGYSFRTISITFW